MSIKETLPAGITLGCGAASRVDEIGEQDRRQLTLRGRQARLARQVLRDRHEHVIDPLAEHGGVAIAEFGVPCVRDLLGSPTEVLGRHDEISRGATSAKDNPVA